MCVCYLQLGDNHQLPTGCFRFSSHLAFFRDFVSQAYHVWGGTSGGWAIDLICPVIKQLAGKDIRLRMVCHTGNESFRTFCATYKFKPENLSPLLGGSFSYASHVRWIERVTAKEHQELTMKHDGSLWSVDQGNHSIGSLSNLAPLSSAPLSTTSAMLSPSSIVSDQSQAQASEFHLRSLEVESQPTAAPGGTTRTAPGRSSALSHRTKQSTSSLDDSFHTSRSFKSCSDGPRAA